MADGAIRQLPGRIDGVLLHELKTELSLRNRWWPIQSRNILARKQIILGMTVAIETPVHVEGLRLPRQWHFVDPSVTGLAAHALVNVNAVIKVNEVRRVIDSNPL